MTLDFEIQRCTRHCFKTGRELKPGETFFSVLLVHGAEVLRHDFAAEAWEGPPEGALGWWRARLPTREGKKISWAPNDVMLELIEELEDQPGKLDMRYVLSLLLLRRRVVRLEDVESDALGRETSILYCPRRETTYRVVSIVPDEQRTREIQEELSKLLFAKTR